MSRFDVIVIGGGPAGAVAALTLARAGARVALIDRRAPRGRRIGESLASAARPLLNHLNLIQVVENGAHLVSFGNHAAWGSSELIAHDFIRDVNGPGWHLDRARFDADLLSVASVAGVELVDAEVTFIERAGAAWRLFAGAAFTAPWIIDATGRAAVIARKLGAVRRRDDDLMALFGWADSADSAGGDSRTLLEAVEHGWWYSSRLADGSRVVAFHSSARVIGALQRDPAGFRKFFGDTEHVSGFDCPGELRATEASGGRLDRFCDTRGWLAVGDAALSFDPLSSQGIFNALYTGFKGAEAIARSCQGEMTALIDYSSRLESIREAYLRHRSLYYAMETRWFDRPFWRSKMTIEPRAKLG